MKLVPENIILTFLLQYELTSSLFSPSDSIAFIVILYMCRGSLFTSIGHKGFCAFCCCVEFARLVLMDAAYSHDVVFQISITMLR
jgi:hypothetical protein